jgi:hypothetical protein
MNIKKISLLFFFVFAYLFQPDAQPADTVVIDTFSSCIDASKLPCGWKERHSMSNIEVNSDSGNYYLTIKTDKKVKSIGIEISVNPNQIPYLHWKWRMHVLPAGGQENKKGKDDSGGGIYVVFKGQIPFNKILKYVWSSTLPQGTLTFSPYDKRVAIVIAESGPQKLDRWINEVHNVQADFKKAFNEEPPPVEAIALESDSDNTKSKSWVDFDNFYFTKSE